MNEAQNRALFNTLGNTEISNFIEQADEIVILAIPSLSLQIANSLINVNKALTHIVFSKEDSSNLRTSEHADAIELLTQHGLELRMSESFSIATLVVDQKGWLFTPRTSAKSINSYAVSKEEAQQLISSLAAIIVNRPVSPSSQPELGEELLPKEIMQTLRVEQKDLVRREQMDRIKNINLEFVELEFKGIRIGSKRIPIPKELTELGMNDEVKEILSSSAKLFTQEHHFSIELKKLEMKRNDLKQDFLINVPHYGMVIQKHVKEAFNTALTDLSKEIEKTKELIHDTLKSELEETKKALFLYYIPIIKATPPKRLLKRHSLFSDSNVEDYLEDLFWSKFPRVDKLVNEIELLCRYKGITIELMNDKRFIKTLQDQGITL